MADDDLDSDVETQAETQDLQDQRDQQPSALPVSSPASFRQTAPGVYSPNLAPTPAPAPALSARSRQFNPSAGFTYDETAPSIGFTPPPPDPSQPSFLKDHAEAVWTAAQGAGQSLLGAAANVTQQLNMPETHDWLQGKYNELGDSIKDNLSKISPDRLRVFTEGLGGVHGFSDAVDWASMNAAALIPTAVTALVPGGILGKVVSKMAIGALGTAAETGAGAGKLASMFTTGGLFGAENMGSWYEETVKAIADAKPEVLEKSPVYAAAKQAGKTDQQAQADLISSVGGLYGAIAFGVGALGGVGVSGILKGGLMPAGAGLIKRSIIGASEGAALMGAQGGTDTALTQAATGQWDPGAIAREAGSQAAGGAVLGAVGGALHGAPEKAASPGTGDVGADETAALNEQLKPSGPTPPAPPPDMTGPTTTADMSGVPGYSPSDTQTIPPRPLPEPTPAPTPPPPPIARSEPTDIPGWSPPGLGLPREAAQGEAASPGPPSAPPATQEAIAKSKGQAPAQAPAQAPVVAEADRPSAGMKLAELKDALAGQADPKSLAKINRNDAAALFDKLNPSTARPESTTVVSGAGGSETPTPESAPAGERLGQAPATDVAPSSPDTAGSLPVPARPAASTTGLTEGLSSVGKAIGANLRDMLWDRFQKGETTEAGGPSRVLMGAKAAQEAGTIKSRADFEQFATDLARVKSQADFDQLAAKYYPKAEPAAKPLTKGEQLRAQRAAAKAKITAPTEVTQAAAHVDEAARTRPDVGELAAAPDAREQARTDAVGQLGDAMRAIPVKAGTPLEAAIRKAQRYMAEEIGKSDGSRDAVSEVIDKWTEAQPKAPYPGSKITPRQVGEHLMKQLTGRELGSRMAEEARALAESQPSMVESETQKRSAEREEAAPREVEAQREAGETPAETSQGQTQELTPVVKKLSDTTDRQRKADELIEKVLDHNDPMTAHEADNIYGKPQPGAGRKRRAGLEYLSDRVKHWLAHAEDTSKERDALIAMAEHDRDTELTGKAKETKTKELQAALDKTGPERAQALRDMLREIEDPVGKAADDSRQAQLEDQMRKQIGESKGAAGTAQPLRMAAPRPDGILTRMSRYIRASRDPRVGANLVRLAKQREALGQPLTLHDVLRHITSDPLVTSEAHPLRALAQTILRHKWAQDVPVYSPDQAHARGLISDDLRQEYRDGLTAGHSLMDAYDPASNHMVVNWDMPAGHIETTMHEAMHTVTSRYLNELVRAHPDHPHIQALVAIGDELARAASESGVLSKQTLTALHNALSHDNLTTGVNELHTMLMTNAELQRFAASHQASPEFRSAMTKLGYSPEQTPSIWRYFTNWVRKALGMPPAGSASEFTMLDHFMHPAGEITTEGAKFGHAIDAEWARVAPADPVLRARAEPLFRTASTSMGERVRETAGRALERLPDARNVGDRAREFVLSGATTDGIVSRYQDILPSVSGWRDAREMVARVGKVFSDNNADRTYDLTKEYNRIKDHDALGQLMNDGTIAETKLGEGVVADANDHLNTPAQQAALADLQSRYDKLSQPAKDFYNKARDLYREWYAAKREAQKQSLLSTYWPDATDTDRKAFLDAAKSKAAMEAYIGADMPALGKAIAKIYNRGYVRGDYFPLRRFGDYVVRYGDRNDPAKYGVEMFERRSQAEARRAELVKQGVDDVYQVSQRSKSAIGDIAPQHPAVDELTDSLIARGKSVDEAHAVRDILNGILLDHSDRSEAARANMKRKGVRGANINQGRVLASEFLNTQASLGHLQHGAEVAAARSAMRREVEDLEGPRATQPGMAVAAASVFREAEKRDARVADPNHMLASLARKANIFSFAQSLLSPSHMITSSIEAHTNSMALLGARHGPRAAWELTQALRQGGPKAVAAGVMKTLAAVRNELKATDWNMSAMMRDRYIKAGADRSGMNMLFRSLENAGLVDHTMLKDLYDQARASGGTKVGETWNRFMNLTQVSAHAVDVMNKSAIAKAAFTLEFERAKKTMSEPAARAKAVEYAVETTRQAMPNYNLANKPRIATQQGFLGALGSPLMQFKMYGMHMYTVMANLAKVGMGSGPAAKEARYAFAGLLATHAMSAGVLTLIADPLRYIGGAYDMLTGATKPHDREADIRGWASDLMGPTAAEAFTRGIPHLLGFDTHSRTGLGNLMEIPEMASFDKDGFGKVMLGLAMGATGENLENLWSGMMKGIQGDWGGALVTALPRPFRDAMKAANLATQGVVTQQGRTILGADKITPWDVALQASGFQPSRVSEAREGSFAVQQARDEAKEQHTKLTDALVKANQGDRAAIMSQIREYNSDPLHASSRINVGQVLFQAQQRQRAQTRGAYGLRLPKQGAQGLIDAGRFANVQ